jgi:gliding motility-associated lipoprotein GldH
MHKIFILSGVLGMLIGCNSSEEEVQTVSLDGQWNKKAEQQFNFEISDSQNPKNIIFVVRNNSSYPYSNIRFIVNVTHVKSKKVETDTVNYILAKPNGEWIGTGFGETKEVHFPYRTNYRFPANGTYKIGIIQAMRNDTLPGIEDLGIKIEKTKP